MKKNFIKTQKYLLILMSLFIITGIFSANLSVSAADLKSKAGQVSIKSGKLNIRSKNSTSSKIVKTLNKNNYITLISKSGSWWKVEYAKAKYGYAHADYIKTVSGTPASVNITSGSLNVRKGAGTSYDVSAKLSKNEVVIVLLTKGDWSKILYHGQKTGYVNKKYLKLKTDSSNNNTTAAYKSVNLKVPDFKQTDSRWADVKIAQSGKTIGQIGCVTTAIAMMESYRTGKTIYPDAMSKKLSYSSTGNVYWPSDYQAVLDSSNYLKGIYNKLSAGKPVLLGAKKSNGQQHWVVVKGFKASNSLSASNFMINDPGSKLRTDLQQFLNAYSTFYKYFYYK